jgi:hypothetical protein
LPNNKIEIDSRATGRITPWVRFLDDAKNHARIAKKSSLHLCEITKKFLQDKNAESFDQLLKQNYYESEDPIKDIYNALDEYTNNEFWDELVSESRNSFYAILLSNTAFETFINMIGHDYLDGKLWEEIKRDNLYRKLFFIKLFLLEKKGFHYEYLERDIQFVSDWRNYIVHFKDYEKKIALFHPCGIWVTHEYEKINADNATFAVNTISNIMKEIYLIMDPDDKEKVFEVISY